MPSSFHYVRSTNLLICLAMAFTIVSISATISVSSRAVEFDLHHLFSDKVKAILQLDDLPEEETVHYYSTMVNRDQFIRRRTLRASDDKENHTNGLGYLHYINASIGTPPVSFFPALTTNNDFTWLPCNCPKCVRTLTDSSGQAIKLNVYNPNASSSSRNVSCNDPLCFARASCASTDTCHYNIQSSVGNTSGNLVEDYFHLEDIGGQTDSYMIPFGCSDTVTDRFLKDYAPNGVLGLGNTYISVPHIIANQYKTSVYFSICFGSAKRATLVFRDQGKSGQAETPLDQNDPFPFYKVSVTKVSVGGKVVDVSFTAAMDSSTESTYLNDPAYTSITKAYDKLVKDKPYTDKNNNSFPYQYCYEMKGKKEDLKVPSLELMMKGGSNYKVKSPVVFLQEKSKFFAYCLGIVKAESYNGIGVKFMEGYRIVFDRERNTLGWNTDDCVPSKAAMTRNLGALLTNCVRVILAGFLLIHFDFLV